MYRVGPLLIRSEDWPPAWGAYASRWFPASAGAQSGPTITVTVECGELADGAEGFAETLSELLSTTRCGPGQWEFRGRGQFLARYDEDAGCVKVRLRTPDEDPALVLGNVLRGVVATSLPNHCDGLMIHACAGICDGKGIIAAGVSTAGKSTMALGFERTQYLSDDVALVTGVNAEPTLAPSPFFGVAGRRGADVSAPLRAIGILVGKVREPETRSSFERVAQARAAAELVRHVARFSTDRELTGRLFDLTIALTERVPVVLVRRSLRDASDDVVRGIIAEAGC